MECAICYEKFFTPKTKKELEMLLNIHVNNKDFNTIMKFRNLLITDNHNETHSCSTPNCNCLICGDCWIKVTHNGKNIDEAYDDDIPNIYTYFQCPFCRNVDWKYYMKNVLNELQQKVLGEEAFNEMYFNKVFPEFAPS
jgi:hypothetical protein